MNEILFLVEEAPEGGFTARAANASIYTEADTIEKLKSEIRDAVRCHFESDFLPKVVRMHFVKEEVFAV
jgi:hypothetical protein